MLVVKILHIKIIVYKNISKKELLELNQCGKFLLGIAYLINNASGVQPGRSWNQRSNPLSGRIHDGVGYRPQSCINVSTKNAIYSQSNIFNDSLMNLALWREHCNSVQAVSIGATENGFKV